MAPLTTSTDLARAQRSIAVLAVEWMAVELQPFVTAETSARIRQRIKAGSLSRTTAQCG